MDLAWKGARAACLLIPLALALAGCSTDPAKGNENAVPADADFRKEAIALLKTSLDDPTNIRGAAISQPMLRPVEGTSRYVACIRFNPRNMNRDYAGPTEYIATFYGGHINHFLKATPGQCSFAAYQPFPELEKICEGARCD